MTLRHYEVTSPEYEQVYDRIDHYDLTASGVDWAIVEAHNAREAVTLAVKQWLGEREDTWPKTQRADGMCPFTGVRARLTVCAHGLCWECQEDGMASLCEGVCPDCTDEFEREMVLAAIGRIGA